MFTQQQIQQIKGNTQQYRQAVEAGTLVEYEQLVERILKADDIPKHFEQAKQQIVMTLANCNDPMALLVSIKMLWDTILDQWQSGLDSQDVEAAVFMTLQGSPMWHLCIKNNQRNFFKGEDGGGNQNQQGNNPNS